MGDIMSSLQGLGSNIMQGVEGIPGDISQGLGDIGKFVGDVGNIFTGAGTPTQAGSALAATSPGVMADAAATVADAAPGAATAAGAAAPALAGQFTFPIGAGQAALGDPTAAMSDFTMPGMVTPQPAMDPSSVLAQATNLPALGPTITSPDTTGAGVGANVLPTGTTATGAIPTGSNFLQSLMRNPNAIKMLGEGGLLGAELLNANKKPPGEAALQQLATQQAAFAKNQGELALGESSGLLPAGLTNMYQQQLDANLAAIRAQHASNPGSSAQMQDEAKARADIQAQMVMAGQQLAQGGWTNVNQATGYQSQLLQEIMAAETDQSTQLGQALAAFAGAAAK